MAQIVSYVAAGYVKVGYTVYTATGISGGAAQQVARIGDATFGVCRIHGNQNGRIISCSGNVFANALGVARLGDAVQADCGHVDYIISGSSTVYANGMAVARVGDRIGQSGIYTASITEGSTNTFAA